MKKYRVYLGACSEYDANRVASIIETALEKIPLSKPIRGKVVIKPNLCMTHPRITSDSFTHKEVTEGILRFLRSYETDIEKIDIVEKSGLGVTTAGMFRWAGYGELKRKYPVRLRAMEENRRTRVVLDRGRMHRHVLIVKEMAERDFLIFAPVLKTNVLSHAYTGALKLNIGTVDGRERLFHHHLDLHVKIVDILEAANPDLIITDGIRLSFGGNQMTQHSTAFGVIAVSTNAVAHDMVCARLLGLDPFKIDHIKEAMDRGYGPKSFDEIGILGDFTIERGHALVKDLDFGFMPVDRFACNFKIHSGKPYCTGGCHGIFLDWLHMIKDRKPGILKKFPKIDVLVGKVDEAISAKTALLVGDCAAASCSVTAKRIVRIKGCPPSHKRIVWDMMVRFFLLGPLVRPSLIIDGFVLYPIKRGKGWLMNLRFNPRKNKRRIDHQKNGGKYT